MSFRGNPSNACTGRRCSNGAVKFDAIFYSVDINGCNVVLDRVHGNLEFLAVDLEFILTHFLGVFLKVKVLSFHALWQGMMVMMPGSTSWTASFK